MGTRSVYYLTVMTGNWSVYYSPEAFLFSLATGYRQKRDVRTNLCVTILIIRVNISL